MWASCVQLTLMMYVGGPYEQLNLVSGNKMAGWSQEETFSLIAIWGSDSIQGQLKVSKRNKSIFMKVASELSAMGYSRTAEQCREKVKKMKGEYRKRKSNEEGYIGKQWKFLDAMDKVMSKQEQDSAEESALHSPLPLLNTTLESSSRDAPVLSRGEETPSVEAIPPRHSEQGLSSCTQASADNVNNNTVTPSTHKRRRECEQATRSDAIHQHLNLPSLLPTETQLLVKLIELQSASEKRQLEMEEKRMRFEERMMERDDQRRREDRQFQLQMMSVIMGRSPVPLSVRLEPHNSIINDDDATLDKELPE